ncbi:hypothetical protein [uncultured Victivallis sp.]|uniref:hypothetical protein n=1 Tax=uncultured Victivallis sp. TaxID=354118 RepID=UPI002591F9E9|nr:hypothetical protein [uncultured Victivallis sp.]
MKIKKSVLVDALKVLGKVVSQTSPVEAQRSVRFLGIGEQVWLTATDGVESVTVEVTGDAGDMEESVVEYKALRELIRSTHGGEVEVTGKRLDWPEMEAIPDDVVTVELPPDFGKLLALAAPIVDRREARPALQGINLSRDGVTVTNGKELLNLPCPLKIPEDVTLPFPLALLTAQPEEAGTLHVWRCRNERLFRIVIGGFQWQGKIQPGNFPDWEQVIPADKTLDYRIEIHEPDRIITFLKAVPDCPPFHAVELNVVPGGITVIPNNFPDMELRLEATVIGAQPRAVLALNKYILLRMLQQGYTKFRAHSDGRIPVIAEGGSGRYIAMPIHILPKHQPEKETSKMENLENKMVSAPVQTVVRNPEPAPEAVDPMEELNHGLDELRGKLRLLLDETGILTRKVKEAVIKQKQKERDFILAKRAIERIRMAI